MELTREQLIVIWIIAILALSVLILIFPKFAKTAGRVVRNAAVGCCLLWAIGAIFGANASVGLNPVTAWGLRNSGNSRRRYADDYTSDFMTDSDFA